MDKIFQGENYMKIVFILMPLFLVGCYQQTQQSYEAQQRLSEMFARMSAGERFGQAVGNARRTQQGLPPIESPRNRQVQRSMTCELRNERISYSTRFCNYDCLGELTVTNVPAVSSCPQAIIK